MLSGTLTQQPCSISSGARALLANWGVSPEQIDQLVTLAARFEYANCLERIKRCAERGGIMTRRDDREAVLLPEFFNYDDPERTGGQCGEIAAKIIALLHSSGWLAEVNAGRSRPLVPYWIWGNSRTHFNIDESRHIWAGLGYEQASSEDILAIDGSFLEIALPTENGYQHKDQTENPNQLALDAGIVVGLSDFTQTENGGWNANIAGHAIVGISTDRTTAIGLSFLIDRTHRDEIRPSIYFIAADGETRTICLRRADGTIAWGNNSDFLSDATKLEGIELLEAAERIRLFEASEATWYQPRITSITLP